MPIASAWTRPLAGLWLCLILSACATPQADSLLTARNAIEPRQLTLDVPFVAQTDDTCGPAALAMVLRDMGHEGDPQQLSLQTLIPGLGGSLQAEMLTTTRRHSLLAYTLAPDLREIVRELQQQRPVIALVNLSFNWWPRWHYLVITGYDLERGVLKVHSANNANIEWKIPVFERLWARGKHWSFVMLEPGQWPASASELQYVQAALDLEHTSGLKAAAPAYRAALDRWPANLIALMGAGNAAYASGDRKAAVGYYRQAADTHIQSAPAANNLAQTLLDLGQKVEALRWAKIAVERGGGLAAQQTLDSISAAQ